MIAKRYILSNLKRINTLYGAAGATSREPMFYSKLAILELCGWIEEAMDSIALSLAQRHLREPDNGKYVASAVKRTYGFDYDEHFRKMLIQVVGIIRIEKLEKKLDPIKWAQLKSTLGALKGQRNIEAHTHLRVIRTLNAPSVTLQNFEKVYAGLEDLEVKIKRLAR